MKTVDTLQVQISKRQKSKILIQGNISYQNHESQGPPRDELVFSSFPLLHLALMRGHATK